MKGPRHSTKNTTLSRRTVRMIESEQTREADSKGGPGAGNRSSLGLGLRTRTRRAEVSPIGRLTISPPGRYELHDGHKRIEVLYN